MAHWIPNFDPEDTPTDDAEQEDNQGEDPVEEAEAVEEERIQDTTRLTKSYSKTMY